MRRKVRNLAIVMNRTGHEAIGCGTEQAPRQLSRAELADPTLPARLALHGVIGLALRVGNLEGYGGLWYWYRGRHRWWRIPAHIEEAAAKAFAEALAETAKRNGGRQIVGDVVPVLLARITGAEDH